MKRRMIIPTLICIFLCFLLYFYWQNVTFCVTHYVYENEAVPPSMDGFRIAQVSDLHNTSYGRGNRDLLRAISEAAPDAIMVTGDIIDSTFTNTAVALEFLEQAVQIAPVYYCTGNHEHRLSDTELQNFLDDIRKTGVTVLDNKSVPFREATLVGVCDRNADDGTSERLLTEADSDFVILLAHKPHYFEHYTLADLILSGHAHGGQIRLPFLGGLFAPGQGTLPEYTKGFYTKNNATMLVSRGLGNSHRIPRLFNRAELVILELKAK